MDTGGARAGCARGVCGGSTEWISQGRVPGSPRGACVGPVGCALARLWGCRVEERTSGGGQAGWGWGGCPGAACSAHLRSPPFRSASCAGSARRGREVSEARAAGSATASAAERHRSLGRRPRLEPRGRRRRRRCGGKLQIPPPPPPPPLPSPSSPPPAQEGQCRRRRAGRERGGAAACPASPSTSPARLPPTCKPLPALPNVAPLRDVPCSPRPPTAPLPGVSKLGVPEWGGGP